MLAVFSMLVPISWTFGESLRYWRMLRKRVALGIGDVVVANRFGLLTMWTAAIGVFPIFNLSVRFFAYSIGHSPEGSAISGEFSWALDVARGILMISGPTMVISTWLIFFPPRRYLARVSASA